MGELPSASDGIADDLEGAAMMRRLQARLFDVPHVPVRVGRFALLRVLGSGGMGVVHLGHDDVLDRRVAIKLIRSERTRSEPARARLLREAQAMARVSHTNVVQVYEAGEHAGHVYVAMELVEGQTLRQWLAGEGSTLPWPRRLQVLRAAGRGLAAAHRAGVVHRDLKPENVLLGADGEPKVGDFGLAGFDEPPSVPTEGEAGPACLTQTGAVVGTPLYMAPEQLEGGAVDARSDQFAFCVVAYEVLLGHRPFEGETLPALTANVTGGRVLPIPSGSRVPKPITAAILRGLSVDPERRFSSMEALLDAMAPRRGRSRALVLGAMGVALGLGGLAWAVAASGPVADTGSPCERAAASWPRPGAQTAASSSSRRSAPRGCATPPTRSSASLPPSTRTPATGPTATTKPARRGKPASPRPRRGWAASSARAESSAWSRASWPRGSATRCGMRPRWCSRCPGSIAAATRPPPTSRARSRIPSCGR